MDYRNELIAVVLVFTCALGTRLLYQTESVVDRPIRADAAKYIDAAYNLRHFGIHSVDIPRKDGRQPQSNTDLPPGYPLFISMFLTHDRLWGGVLKVQAVMGAFVSVFTLLLARMALPLPWAVTAGVLTAFCPHLIAMDYYFLSEGLFSFIMMLGMLLMALSWRYRRYGLSLSAGLLLTLSAHVRTVSLLLLFFLSPVYLVSSEQGRSTPWKRLGHFVCLVTAFLMVTGAHNLFVRATSIPEKAGGQTAVSPHQRYANVSVWADRMKSCLTPPEFYIQGTSHVYARNGHREYRNSTRSPFRENPLRYIQWVLYGKLVTMWHWDDLFNGDVYIYPMLRKGFEENSHLKWVHGSMRAIHWPLFALSVGAIPMLWFRWRRKTLPVQERALLIPAMAFVYFLAVLWLISWITRYTIPVRPISYILASASLYWLWSYIGSLLSGARNTK